MPQECTRTQMRTHYPLPAIMQAKDVKIAFVQLYNSRTSIPSGGFLILWLQSSVAGTVVFFVSGAKGGLCKKLLSRSASGQRGCPNREHVHFSMDTCRHPATPRDTLRHGDPPRRQRDRPRRRRDRPRRRRDPPATEAQQTATRPATSWRHPATSWRHARHFDDRYLDTHRSGGGRGGAAAQRIRRPHEHEAPVQPRGANSANRPRQHRFRDNAPQHAGGGGGDEWGERRSWCSVRGDCQPQRQP